MCLGPLSPRSPRFTRSPRATPTPGPEEEVLLSPDDSPPPQASRRFSLMSPSSTESDDEYYTGAKTGHHDLDTVAFCKTELPEMDKLLAANVSGN